ncbi:methyltransferase domain-containing protein [Streptomyces platensis]|uniref:Protein-L-isoaspartate O-methyltransferase n=1 Tax=Streptomyces platensis TaxID=58346 RepID=A0AAE6NIH5_STRPT|nr:methyltransferase domain-containing protein [Streptomyces platensis]OSY45796.1 Protein-L-isoaspartate O-methyltransferase [Streptomyces platensis]QEV53699.1 methyltransferase domain-containing protein [Streptomyces platensis]BCK69827.1 protein-L-isoaspartate O-methyltransferase [Streptomyces libani subsp. rufus]
MTSYPAAPDEALGDLLDRIAGQLGSPAPAHLRAALRAVPRHLFLPSTLWLRDGNGGHEPCDRESAPDQWWRAAYSDAPLVTQFAEGPDGDRVPSSSASMPSVVVRMLKALNVRPGHSVLEIGTGTGFNAALLSFVCGPENVTSLDVDPELTRRAQRALKACGRQPEVICADGAGGWQPNAPYDRIIATCSVRTVPLAWLEQTVTGGLLVIPWDTPWCNFGTLLATKQADGTAEGTLAPYGSFMLLRAQQVDAELRAGVPFAGQEPECSTTAVSPWAVAGNDLDAQMYIGLRVPGVWHVWDTEVDEAHTRLLLADGRTSSWACVDYDGQQTSAFAVAQYGTRKLWDEVVRAYEEYVAAGRPGVHRHRLRITPDGRSTRHEVSVPA